MKESLTPEKIKKEVLTGDLGKENAVELLLSLIEGSDNIQTRVESIKALEKINLQSERIFKILENFLISDENAVVRASVADYIINNFTEYGQSALIWVIQHERCPLVLNTFYDSIEKFEIPQLKQIKKELLNWNVKYADEIGVVPQESRFFLDFEALFAQDKKSNEIEPQFFKNFTKLSNVKNGEPWLVIKNQHVEVLNFNYFNWKWVKENQDIIKSLYGFKYLDVYFNSLSKYNIVNDNFFELPDSIGKLIFLKKLILKGNMLKEIPKSIENLISLKELDISFNKFYEIPQIIGKLKSIKKLNIKGNKIQEISHSSKKIIVSLRDFKY
jgi:hypothetical protein